MAAATPRFASRRVLMACAICVALGAWALSGVAEEGRGAVNGPVAQLGSQQVDKAALADFWFQRYPEEYARTLDALLDQRVADAVARRLGVRVPAPQLDAAVGRELAARRKQLEALYGKEVTLEQEVQRAYNMPLAAWEGQVLRPRLRDALLLDRIVRLWSRSREVLETRIIVLDDAARARRTFEKLRQGADFSLVAAKSSSDPTAKQGGVLPPIARGDLTLPGVEARLFAAQEGQLVGPLSVRIDGRVQWHIYKIIRRRGPWTHSGAALYQALEADIGAEPVTRAEFVRWREGIRRESGVRYFRPDGAPWRPPGRR